MSYQFKLNELNQECFFQKKGLNSIYFPNKVGSIHTFNKNISDDILLIKENIYANDNFKMEAEFAIADHLLISGTLKDGEFTQNNFGMGIKENTKQFLTMDKGMQRKGIGILIKKSFLDDNLFSHLKDKKRMQLEKNEKEGLTNLFKSSLASTKTLSLAKEIYNSPFDGALNNIYLQSKVYEIIHNEFLTLINKEDKKKKIILSQKDKEALYQARELILQNKRNFSLDELSRKTALNQTKLKYGFKQLFDTTPGNIMLEARMYEAKRLLETSEYNVSEIAQITGYKYVQNFTKAFVKFFGTPPSESMKSRNYYY